MPCTDDSWNSCSSMPCLLHHTICSYPCCHRIDRVLLSFFNTQLCIWAVCSSVSLSYPPEFCCNRLRLKASLVNTDPIFSACLSRSEIARSDRMAVLFLIFQGTSLVFAILTVLITSFSRAVFLHFLARACFLPLPSREREGSRFLVYSFILSRCTQLPSIFLYHDLSYRSKTMSLWLNLHFLAD